MADIVSVADTSTVINVVEAGGAVVQIPVSTTVVNIVEAGQILFAGGGGGGGGQVHTQSAAAATWSIAHGLGRLPAVSIYLNSGEEVDTDVTATSTGVTITFPNATSGFAILT